MPRKFSLKSSATFSAASPDFSAHSSAATASVFSISPLKSSAMRTMPTQSVFSASFSALKKMQSSELIRFLIRLSMKHIAKLTVTQKHSATQSSSSLTGLTVTFLKATQFRRLLSLFPTLFISLKARVFQLFFTTFLCPCLFLLIQ